MPREGSLRQSSLLPYVLEFPMLYGAPEGQQNLPSSTPTGVNENRSLVTEVGRSSADEERFRTLLKKTLVCGGGVKPKTVANQFHHRF